MPVYEFKCKVCDSRFEYPTNKVDAYHCGQNLIRVYSAGIQFKGSGFHKNDYGGSRDK